MACSSCRPFIFGMFMSEMIRCEGCVIIIFMACSPSDATWMLRKPSDSRASRTSRRLVVVSSTTRILSCASSDIARIPLYVSSVQQARPGLVVGQDAVERDQADHSSFHRDHSLHEGARELRGDIRSCLDGRRFDRENV